MNDISYAMLVDALLEGVDPEKEKNNSNYTRIEQPKFWYNT